MESAPSNHGIIQAFSSLGGNRLGGGPAKPAIPLQKPNMMGFLPPVCSAHPTPQIISRNRFLKCYNDLEPFAPFPTDRTRAVESSA